MKKLFIIFVLGLLTLNLYAQDDKKMMEEVQKKWMEYMAPSAVHEMMAKSVGEWTSENKYWMTPDGEAQVSTGTVKNEMILGGRYLLSHHEGVMMNMPFKGFNINAYDNAKGEMISVWLDNMGTGVAIASGKYKEGDESFVLEGSMTDPMTGGDAWFKEEIKFIDNDTQTMTMWMKNNGESFKGMEILFKRKK